jgi:hypothetical protein
MIGMIICSGNRRREGCGKSETISEHLHEWISNCQLSSDNLAILQIL